MQAMLWIMRHAEAGPTTDAKDDDKRPLTALGRQQAEAGGIALAKIHTPIQCVISSTLTRATETAELAAKALKLDVKTDKRLNGPPLDPDDVCKGNGNCLIVSHEPSVSLMTYRLTGAQLRFTKGGLVQIHEGEMWSLLNPSDTMVMAGMGFKGDPQTVDERGDDVPLEVRQAEFRSTHRLSAWHL